jgi:hypothetical protein
MVHIDEWGFPEQSNILRCEVSRDQEMIRCSPDDINKLSDSSIRAETKAIKLKRNSTATTVSVSTAIRRINDDLMWGFLTPTENPVIQLSLPENLDGKADAGIPGSEEGKSTVVPYQYEFTGVYFPPAHMRVRWWPKEQAQLTVESREIATP